VDGRALVADEVYEVDGVNAFLAMDLQVAGTSPEKVGLPRGSLPDGYSGGLIDEVAISESLGAQVGRRVERLVRCRKPSLL
jgi:hypothetical protein